MNKRDPDPVGLLSGERRKLTHKRLPSGSVEEFVLLSKGQTWTDSSGRTIDAPAGLYHVGGKLHRSDGPAVLYEDGGSEWWVNGQLHREDGPAIDWTNGHRAWYRHGELHREDGPGEIFADGDVRWSEHGERVSAQRPLAELKTSR